MQKKEEKKSTAPFITRAPGFYPRGAPYLGSGRFAAALFTLFSGGSGAVFRFFGCRKDIGIIPIRGPITPISPRQHPEGVTFPVATSNLHCFEGPRRAQLRCLTGIRW